MSQCEEGSSTVSSPCREMYLYTVAEAECCPSVEGEAAQERRVAVCIARGINWLSFDCQHAMDNSIRMDYIGSSGWLHVPSDLSRDRQGMHLARGSFSVGCWRIFVWGMRKEDGEKSAIICLLLKLKYFALIEVEIRVNVM